MEKCLSKEKACWIQCRLISEKETASVILMPWSEYFIMKSMAFLKSSFEGCNQRISLELREAFSHSEVISGPCCRMRKLDVSISTGSDENSGVRSFSRTFHASSAGLEYWSSGISIARKAPVSMNTPLEILMSHFPCQTFYCVYSHKDIRHGSGLHPESLALLSVSVSSFLKKGNHIPWSMSCFRCHSSR